MDIRHSLRTVSAALDEIAVSGRYVNETRPSRLATNVRGGVPDLQTQFEDLLGEVWRQEQFERTHPYTCGVIRQLH